MNYCEEKGISISKLNDAQRTLYYIAENMKIDKSISEEGYEHFQQAIKALEPRKGEWLRMSDLSEQEDDRYKCSRCGNVIHHKDKTDLYTFNSWCGRCGSDNGRKIEPRKGERNKMLDCGEVSCEYCHKDKCVYMTTDKIDALDKIRAEIESQREKASEKSSEDEGLTTYYFGLNDGLKDARDIIDKYKAESEE